MNLVNEFLLLLLLLFAIGQSASWAVRASVALAHRAGLSEFLTSFLVVSFISILPETFISIISAFRGVPEIGLGTLLGSNVADLSFVFGAVALLAPHALRVESSFIKNDYLFLAFLTLPLLLGSNGHFSRAEGIILILSSFLFLWALVKFDGESHHRFPKKLNISLAKNIAMLTVSFLVMGAAAHYAVLYAGRLAQGFSVTPALVGLLVVALGTCLPELLFSIRATHKNHETLAFGDVLGTVIIDITFVLGLIAVIHPFSFNPRLILVTGFFMLLSGLLALSLLRSGRKLTRPEGALLLAFYALFVTIEFMLRNWNPFG